MGRSRVLCMFQWGHRSDKATMRRTRCVPLVGAAVPGCPAVGGCRCRRDKANTQDPVGAVINRPKVGAVINRPTAGYRRTGFGHRSILNR